MSKSSKSQWDFGGFFLPGLVFCLAALLLMPVNSCIAGETNLQQLTLPQFETYLHGIKPGPFKETLSAEENYRLKRTAETLSDDSWAAILQLWATGDVDYVRLLWWQKDDTETRAFIVALEWCMVSVPAKNDPWPEGIDDFEFMAMRFAGPERELRLRECDFVREHRARFATEIGRILSAGHNKMGKQYLDWGEALSKDSGKTNQTSKVVAPQGSSLSVTQIVENIVLVESLVPKQGEPQTDPHAAAIVALGRKAGPLLADKIIDDRDSKWFDMFQYKTGDIAHALLCDIYHQNPSGALIHRQPPVDATHGYYYRDYVVMVSSPAGRAELQAAWRKIIAEAGK